MKLRYLMKKDAPFMLEWMHDETVVRNLKTDFSKKTLDDCHAFISAAQDTKNDLHLAIVDENDNYMGTVSLKHIYAGSAEFAITIRTIAMGKGFSSYAMKEIIKIGIWKYRLKKIYWCVSPKNERAVRFYDKNGYHRVQYDTLLNIYGYSDEEIKEYCWYLVTKEEMT